MTAPDVAGATLYAAPPGECILWTGCIDRRGYGVVKINYKSYFGHRLAYAQVHGPIPPGMTVDHICFTTACVNPDHLQLLTMVENARRQRSTFRTHCVNGHEFTPENTRVRWRRPDGSEGGRDCITCMRARARRSYLRRTGRAA